VGVLIAVLLFVALVAFVLGDLALVRYILKRKEHDASR
jgi:hypothetical protein